MPIQGLVDLQVGMCSSYAEVPMHACVYVCMYACMYSDIRPGLFASGSVRQLRRGVYGMYMCMYVCIYVCILI